jgi:hypothetical protein
MAHIVRDWRTNLIEAHPDLFHPLPDNPRVAQAPPECGAGWRDLLERACARVQAAIQADGGTFQFTQIKQKYGTARLYWEGTLSPDADARVEEAIDLAEARSACTCETCGEVGRLFNDNGCLLTACDQHAKGHPVAEKPGWENVTISRVDARGSKTVIVKRRRYVWETDSFVEADPLFIGEGG